MQHENKITIALIVLSFSILMGSVIISLTINQLSKEMSSLEVTENKQNILSLDEASDYLGVTSKSLENTIERTSIGIPFLKLEGNYIFTKKGLDEWLANNHIDLD